MTKLVKLYMNQHSSKTKARKEHGTVATLGLLKAPGRCSLSHPAGKALERWLLVPLGERGRDTRILWGPAPFPRSRFQARPGTAGMRCPPPTAPSLTHPRGSAGTARAQPGTKRHQHFQTRVPPAQAERGTATKTQLPTKSRPAERRKRRPEVTLGRHRGAPLSSFSPPSTFSLLRQPPHRGLAHNAASLFPPPALLPPEGPHGMRGPSLPPFLSPPPMPPRNSYSRPDALPFTLPSAPPQVGGRDPPGERQRAPSRSPGLTLKMA